jgi:Tfp pilus assembly protein PilF
MTRAVRRAVPPGARWVAAALALGIAVAGCEKPPQSQAEIEARAAAGLRARSQALIENGNHAFRTGDYALAARRYASATTIDAKDPAAYYGLGMALTKLGRDEQARAAYATARELVRQGYARSDSGPGRP